MVQVLPPKRPYLISQQIRLMKEHTMKPHLQILQCVETLTGEDFFSVKIEYKEAF